MLPFVSFGTFRVSVAIMDARKVLLLRAVLRSCRGRWVSVPWVVICKNQEQGIISETGIQVFLAASEVSSREERGRSV